MKMFATTEMNFEAGHCLRMQSKSDEENRDIYGKCYNVHGHNYKLNVTVEGEVQEDGMIINFKTIKAIIKKEIIDFYDHKFINELMDDVPTAENMCSKIWKMLDRKFETLGINLYEIELYETDTSCIKLRR